MYCWQCGKETPDGSRFCRYCGANLSELNAKPISVKPAAAPPAAEQTPKKVKRRGHPVLILCALVLVVGIAAAAVLMSSKGGYAKNYRYRTDSITLGDPGIGDDRPDIGSYYHADGTRVDVDPEYTTDAGGILFFSANGERAPVLGSAHLGYFDGKGIQPLYGIFSYPFLAMSYDGMSVLYQERDSTSGNTTLKCIRYGEKDTRQTEQFEITGGFVNNAYISPQGNTVVFFIDDNGSGSADPAPGGYMWKKGEKPVRIDNCPTAITAVTDDGDLIYHLGENGGIYAWTKEGDRCLTDDESVYVHSRCYTANNREILYSDSNGGHICVDGEQDIWLSPGDCFPLLPDNIESFQYSIDAYDLYRGINSFAGSFVVESVYTNDAYSQNILFVDRNYEVHRAAYDVSYALLANDGKTIVYMKNGTLYRVDGTKDGAKPVQLTDTYVQQYSMTPDGKTVFYNDSTGSLYVSKGGKSTWLSDNVYIAGYRAYGGVNMCGDTLYFISDGVLYSTKGDKPISYRTEFEGRVENVWCDGLSVDVEVEDDEGNYLEYRRTGDGQFALTRFYSPYNW